MDITTIKKVHMIGVGGIGMSALARHFLHEKKWVSGSDRAPSPITDALVTEGARFFPSQVAENIEDGIDLVVYTEAMSQDHEEIVAARAKNIPCINYFEALGLVANQYHLIAVSGSHGKTTTTAMLIDIFEDADLDPSAVVGSLRARTGSNYRAGKGKFFIAEACEYRRDFLHLKPEVLVITNIEAEHLDYYKDLDDVILAFNELVMQVPESGVIICNAKDAAVSQAIKGAKAKVIDYTDSIDLLMPMLLPGMHNRMNAAAAVAASVICGIETSAAKSSVSAFRGTWRRFELKGETTSGALVYDDYGHHPSEIKATILGARERHPDKRIVLVYEPHMYSRTHALFADFVAALALADEVILTPIYAAREANNSGVTSEMLASALAVPAHAVPDFLSVCAEARARFGNDTVILVMGAGTIYQLAPMLART